ncbi:coiled-coil domain-containing protein 22 [Pieris napi]|uniref:coiled-coil domain-containing protein 22 n=1 Tax=Pieris napi TaxID=78633 RepID=UPI001FBA7C43|nr:coiled-coil domain-containing protein 22 [Pieris napi]
MEEVDSIIIHFLRQLNVNINEDVKNLCDIPVETIIEAAAQCISNINPNLKVPIKLPTGVSQRIGVATQIATSCKELGYKNDVGYQTFLYYNETELRQVFMFLIEKLPSEDKKPNVKVVPSNKKQELLQQISLKIAEDLNTIWIPPCCKNPIKMSFGDYIYRKEKVMGEKLDDNILIEKLKRLQNIKIENTPIIDQTNRDTNLNNEIQTKKMIKESLKELKETTIQLKQKLDMLTSERNVMEVEFSQAQKSCERVDSDLRNIENVLKSVGITDIDSENSVDNLLEVVHKNLNRMHCKVEDLTSKNLSLKVDIEKLKTEKDFSELSERNNCKKNLIDLKEKAKGVKDECEKKEELRIQLKAKYEKMKGGNKRHIYTKRILEIIGNVDKQNMEIKKVLEDTRHLQKEINSLEGQLGRCFSIADETLFKDAKKDDQAKKAYKLLALLHSECNTIVSLVNETGTLARDIVDLEDNIKTEKSKQTENILQKIQLDLANLQKESN